MTRINTLVYDILLHSRQILWHKNSEKAVSVAYFRVEINILELIIGLIFSQISTKIFCCF